MGALTRLLLLFVFLLPLQHIYAQDDEAGEEGAVTPNASIYMDLKPAFVVNYGGVGKLRYLKTNITLRLESQGSASIRRHMPYIRHTLVMLLSKSTDDDMSSMEGKELLRHNALEAVRALLVKEEGEHFVKDLLFSSFIVQQ
ncbi:MAG: flagellar FliL protein [Oceanicoccus sp.]|jgi:flagellar FliL protein